MEQGLSGMCVAILVTDGFDQCEMTEPRRALVAAGAATRIVSSRTGQVQGIHCGKPGDRFDIDATFAAADPNEFDAVLLPGGIRNGERIRGNPAARDFVESFYSEGKPIAAICHGLALVISAGIAAGRRLTGAAELSDEARQAGALWVDQAVVTDGALVCGRGSADLAAFIPALLAVLAQANKRQQAREGSLRRQHPGDRIV